MYPGKSDRLCLPGTWCVYCSNHECFMLLQVCQVLRLLPARKPPRQPSLQQSPPHVRAASFLCCHCAAAYSAVKICWLLGTVGQLHFHGSRHCLKRAVVYCAEGQSTSAFAQGSAPSTSAAAAPAVDPSQQYPSAPEAPQEEQPVESHSHRIMTGTSPYQCMVHPLCRSSEFC